MSMHKIPLTQLEEDGLRAHGLDIGTPSQLSDVFRHGIKWALKQTEQQPIGWITEDYLTDKSATTYSPEVADRWRAKGWPVSEIYASPSIPPLDRDSL